MVTYWFRASRGELMVMGESSLTVKKTRGFLCHREESLSENGKRLNTLYSRRVLLL